jgi:hypothetical protein
MNKAGKNVCWFKTSQFIFEISIIIGSSQTGGFVSGVGAPAYLSVSGYEFCLDEYTPTGTSHSEFCLPQKRPFSCTENSWNQLKNVFKGDCPQSGVIGGKNFIPN